MKVQTLEPYTNWCERSVMITKLALLMHHPARFVNLLGGDRTTSDRCGGDFES